MRIDIHQQIYKWRQILSERNQLPLVKKEAMQIAGKVFASPRLYRAALAAASKSVDILPRFLLYNRLNVWGRQREIPEAPPTTFRQWYIENRINK